MKKLLHILSLLLPYRRFTIQTPLSRQKIARMLGELTSPYFSLHRNEFLGKVNEEGFKITANLHFERTITFVRNDFMPVMIGKLQETEHGTMITVKQRMLLPISIFSYLVLAISLLELLVSPPYALLIFGVMQLFVQLGFALPARKARKRLEELLVVSPYD